MIGLVLYDPSNHTEAQLTPSAVLRIWPNPAREGWLKVVIEPTLQEKPLIINGLSGCEVRKSEASGVLRKLSLEGLPPGGYWVQAGTSAARFVVE